MRLRTLLTFVFAVSALALTLAGSLAVYRFATARAQDRVETRMADLAEQLHQRIDANVAERLGDMRVLTSVARTTAAAPDARRIWVEALATTYPAYAWIGFADRGGMVTASTGGVLEGASVSARPWFQRGLDAVFVGDVHEATLLAKKLPPQPYGEPYRFVDVAAPLRDAAGTVTGVVGAHLSLTWMRALGRTALTPVTARDPSVEVLILAGDGTVILGPSDLEGERLPADLNARVLQEGEIGRAARMRTWPDGHAYIIGTSRAAAGAQPTLPWTVLVRQPVELAFASTRAFTLKLAGVGVACACLFALIGWWAATRIAAPLLALARAAHVLDDTENHTTLPVPRGYTEVGELTGALDGLLGRLAERDQALAAANGELERRVAARTRELAQSHAFVRSILDASPSGILVLLPDGRLEYSNDAAARMWKADTGLDPRPLHERWPASEREALRKATSAAMEADACTDLTTFCPSQDDASRWLRLAVAPIRAADGRPERILMIASDVTSLKAAEAELVQARDKAEAADRAKSEFLATMSHEIRTPLNAIKGFNDLLGDDPGLSTKQRLCVQRVQTSCDALITVVDDILDFARIEAGRIALESRPFSPRALVEEAVAIVQGLADRKRLDLRVEIEPDLPSWLTGDANRLRQVLLNFVNNAIKFTPSGSVTISARYEVDAPEERLHVAVRDTGIGIPDEAQARLFTRFSQADSSTSRRYGGSGLGLAIAKGLIEAMGGSVGLVSRDGGGSTFWLRAPLARAERPAEAEDRVTTRPSSSGDHRGRLLLVEDVAINREIAQAILERGGYSVDVAGNGLEALRAVVTNAYDLVLMDIEMPEMDGVAATQAIRALAHPARRVPIIAMTANVLADQVARFKQAGMDDHVGKPFDRRKLFATIEAWVEKADARDTHRISY